MLKSLNSNNEYCYHKKNGCRAICCVASEEKVFYLRNYIYEKSIVGDYRVSSSGRTGMAPWHVHT